MPPRAIVGARLPDRTVGDVVIDDERIVRVGAGAGSAVADRVDARGGALLPAFIDTHIHLDKVLIRDQLVEHDGTLQGAIDSIHVAKRAYTKEDVRRRAAEVIQRSVQTGTTRLRTHVDVDTVGGLTPLEGVLAAARDCADIAEVEIIAFPQEGIVRDSGADELMAKAMESGATIVGGMPHWERTVEDQRKHVHFCFELARRYDADLDMHVDETDDGSVRTLAMVVEETERRGWQGRVTVGHVCALAAADHEYADRVIAGCARNGIIVVSNPVTNLVIQGRGDRGLIRRGTTRIRELMAAGVGVAFGQDCVKDGFYPFGTGDMLEVALISAHVAHLATAEEIDDALAAITTVPARAWHITDTYGVRAGARADLQLYREPDWESVLRAQEPPLAVWHRGRVVARNSATHELVRG